MSSTFYARGSLDFNGGKLTTEYLAYVLAGPGYAASLDFQQGTAKVYNLSPATLLAYGTTGIGSGYAIISGDPSGAFENFALYPEGSPDLINGFVLANNNGAQTGGVGAAWTRHYSVLVPPKNACYAVPHVRLGSVAAGSSQYFDAHQFEVLRTDQSAPTPFGPARSLLVTVRPARLNYAMGSTHVTSLIPGRLYTASADVNGSRRSMTFKATSPTVDLDFGGAATRILVEEGTELGEYFDGSDGDDYLWEQGGVPGATRSYYYPDRVMRHYVLVRTLQENVAMGIVVADPVYAVLPSPSSVS